MKPSLPPTPLRARPFPRVPATTPGHRTSNETWASPQLLDIRITFLLILPRRAKTHNIELGEARSGKHRTEQGHEDREMTSERRKHETPGSVPRGLCDGSLFLLVVPPCDPQNLREVHPRPDRQTAETSAKRRTGRSIDFGLGAQS